jgi:hypothetical protein
MENTDRLMAIAIALTADPFGTESRVAVSRAEEMRQ